MLTRQTGTALDGTYSGTMTIPRFSAQGDWTVDFVYVADEAYNSAFIGTAALAAAGFPTKLHVGP